MNKGQFDKFMMEDFEMSGNAENENSLTITSPLKTKSHHSLIVIQSLGKASSENFNSQALPSADNNMLSTAEETPTTIGMSEARKMSLTTGYEELLTSAKSLVEMIEFTIMATKLTAPPTPDFSTENMMSLKSDHDCSCVCHNPKKSGLTKDQLNLISEALAEKPTKIPNSIVYVPKLLRKSKLQMTKEELHDFYEEVKSLRPGTQSPYGSPMILVPKAPHSPIILIPKPADSASVGFIKESLEKYFGDEIETNPTSCPMLLIPQQNNSPIVMIPKQSGRAETPKEQIQAILDSLNIDHAKEGYPVIMIPKPPSSAIVVVTRPSPAEPLVFVHRGHSDLECQCLVRRLELEKELNKTELETIAEELPELTSSEVSVEDCERRCTCNCHISDISPSAEEIRGSANDAGACAGTCSIHCPKKTPRTSKEDRKDRSSSTLRLIRRLSSTLLHRK